MGGEKFRSEEEREINRNVHLAAITEEQAEAIKKQLKKRKMTKTQPRKYLLTDVLQSSICKGPMFGDSGFYTCINKKKHIIDYTNNKISSDYIDQKAITFVKRNFVNKNPFSKRD